MPAQPIAVQLYTLRELAANDLAGTLAQLAGTGFGGVETADFHGRGPRAFRSLVANAGLAICSSHGMALGPDAERVLDDHAELGSPLVVIPALGPERFADRNAVGQAADELNRSAELAEGRGLSLAYHNHFWEWNALPDGSLAFEALVAALDPRVQLEIDVYWAQVAGQRPAQLIRACGDRVTRLHVKDGPADRPESKMTAAGQGAVDLAACLAAAAAAEWLIVELDHCATDMMEAVEASYRHLRRITS